MWNRLRPRGLRPGACIQTATISPPRPAVLPGGAIRERFRKPAFRTAALAASRGRSLRAPDPGVAQEHAAGRAAWKAGAAEHECVSADSDDATLCRPIGAVKRWHGEPPVDRGIEYGVSEAGVDRLSYERSDTGVGGPV